eukprot:COSAG01_NODE_4962_length_4588_cov_6.072845_3_plen_63_part_00
MCHVLLSNEWPSAAGHDAVGVPSSCFLGSDPCPTNGKQRLHTVDCTSYMGELTRTFCRWDPT